MTRKRLPSVTDERSSKRSALVNSNVVTLPVIRRMRASLAHLAQIDRELNAKAKMRKTPPCVCSPPCVYVIDGGRKDRKNFATSPAYPSGEPSQVMSRPQLGESAKSPENKGFPNARMMRLVRPGGESESSRQAELVPQSTLSTSGNCEQ